jgi:acetoacetyl-CoA synthetase
MPLGAKPGRGAGLLEYGRAIAPQRGRRTRRHRTDAVDAHQIPGGRRRKPVPPFLLRYVSRVWQHGDWVTHADDYAMIVHDRSGAALSRNGMRMGASGIDHAAQTVSDFPESPVVGVEEPGGDWMPLFVSLAPGAVRDDRLRSAIRIAIREGASPPRLSGDILQIGAAPHTLTGREAEVPAKRILAWSTSARRRRSGAVDRADVLVEIADLAAARSPS